MVQIGTLQSFSPVIVRVLYDLFVSPLFDLTQITNFADDNFYLEWNTDLALLIVNLEKKLEMITKWLRDSGMIVNESKTEVCLFHRNDKPVIQIKVQNVNFTSKKSINVLGVIFDYKLTWNIHIASAITKAKKSLFALHSLKIFFNNNEMRTLLDTNFYSILYYNAVIWLTPNISCDAKHSLLSISANALRSCLMFDGFNISFENIHKINNKCTPSQIMLYQIALNLHRTLNFETSPTLEQTTLLDQIRCGGRQLKFEIIRNFKGKIGMNTTANKFFHISKLIGLDLLNLKFVHFKKIIKIQFLKYGKT